MSSILAVQACYIVAREHGLKSFQYQEGAGSADLKTIVELYFQRTAVRKR